jgi:hypothetical protein
VHIWSGDVSTMMFQQMVDWQTIHINESIWQLCKMCKESLNQFEANIIIQSFWNLGSSEPYTGKRDKQTKN